MIIGPGLNEPRSTMLAAGFSFLAKLKGTDDGTVGIVSIEAEWYS